MKLDARLAQIIPARLRKFEPRWQALDEARRQDCTKIVILVELVGGRGKAAAVLDVSDNTIDNHRKGTGDVSHAALKELTEGAGLPQAALYFRWSVDDGELVFRDAQDKAILDPWQTGRPGAQPRYDVPPLAYNPGQDHLMQPGGMAEGDDVQHLTVPRDYLGRLQADPRSLLAMVVRDDGMVPEIEEGALLLVDVSDRLLTDGCLYVLDTGAGAIVRRVRRLARGEIELLCADSKLHPPLRLTKPDVAGLDLIGRLRSHSKSV